MSRKCGNHISHIRISNHISTAGKCGLHLRLAARACVLKGMHDMTPFDQKLDRLQRLIGKAIADKRRARGYSVAEVAFAAGVSEPGLDAIEGGFDPPTIICLARIAGVLECDLSDILATAEAQLRETYDGDWPEFEEA